jgi:protein associated with RNAse G/E
VADSSQITVKTYKYDGKPHREWKCELIEQKGDLLVLLGVFDREIAHPHLGVIRAGTISYEYYWLDRWYNVFRFHEPDGALRNYYCNINLPPKFEGGILEYVDLDIDIYVSKNMEIALWDADEFRENTSLYNYPSELIDRVNQTVTELSDLIKSGQFPF